MSRLVLKTLVSCAHIFAFSWAVNEHVTFKQSFTTHFDPSDSAQSLFIADASLDTAISSALSWRIAASWSYDRSPAAGRKKEDTLLTTGLAISF